MTFSASPTVKAAVRLTQERYPGVTLVGLVSPTRLAIYTEARSFAMSILRAKGWSLKQIARGFNRKDHTTALNSVRRAEKLFPLIDFVFLAERLSSEHVQPAPLLPASAGNAGQADLPSKEGQHGCGFRLHGRLHKNVKVSNPGNIQQRRAFG